MDDIQIKPLNLGIVLDERHRLGEGFIRTNKGILVVSEYLQDGMRIYTDSQDSTKIYAIYSNEYYKAIQEE